MPIGDIAPKGSDVMTEASRHTVSRSELSKLPYFAPTVQDDRVVPLLPYLNDEGKWEMWLPGRSGLVKSSPLAIVEGDYFAKSPASEVDVYIEFLNLITKRVYWPDVASLLDCVRDDIHNLAASLTKIDFFFESRTQADRDFSRFVSTDVEYVAITCRSLFDLLQKVVSRLWKRVQLYDTSIKKKPSLPKSFRDMVLYKSQLQGPDEIKQRHGLPQPLADFYHRAGPFFVKLRDFRDDLVHSGASAGPIFQTPRGFAVDTTRKPFSSFPIWEEKDLLPHRLGSLRLLNAHMITETIATCEDFAVTMQETLELPPDIAPDYRLFLRGHHLKSLLTLRDILAGDPWWE
jgi:hypothetical protein